MCVVFLYFILFFIFFFCKFSSSHFDDFCFCCFYWSSLPWLHVWILFDFFFLLCCFRFIGYFFLSVLLLKPFGKFFVWFLPMPIHFFLFILIFFTKEQFEPFRINIRVRWSFVSMVSTYKHKYQMNSGWSN